MSRLPVIRAAAVQAEPVILDLDATVAKACDLIREAAGNGAQLVVFPEMFIPTYVNGSIWDGASRFGALKRRGALFCACGKTRSKLATHRQKSSAGPPARTE